MTLDQGLWDTARAAALTSFFVLSASIVTGQALRSSLFEGAVPNRALLGLHRFLTLCWLPLIFLHVLAITLDSVSRVSVLDLLIPFRVSYAAIPIGLGTIGFDLLLIVTGTSYLRARMDPASWRWLHRLAYVMFAIFALHGLLAGTDFSRSLVLAPAAGVVAFVGVLTVARLAFARLATAGD